MAKDVKNLQVPEDVLTSFGLNVENLKKSEKIWESLTKGEKTPLLSLKGRVGERAVPVSAKLHLWEDAEGMVQVAIHAVQSSINLRPYKGHEFTNVEKAMLLSREAQIKHPIELTLGSKTMSCLVGVDTDTKEIVHLPTQNVYVQEKILGVQMSAEDTKIIKNGGKVLIKDFEKNGEKFDSVVSFSFSQKNGKGALIFSTPTPELLQEARISAGLTDGKKEKKEISKEESKQVSVPKKTRKTKGIGM